MCCLQETCFRSEDTHRLKVRVWKKIFHANGNQKKAGIAILISDKIDFKVFYFKYCYLISDKRDYTVKTVKEGYYIMMKGSI